MSGSRQAERRSRRTRHPRDDPRAEIGKDVRVGVGVRVGPVEFQLDAAVGKFTRQRHRDFLASSTSGADQAGWNVAVLCLYARQEFPR